VPDQYDWDVWSADEDDTLPHSYVYHRDVSLQAGRTYHFLTRNLQPVTPAHADPVMYLVRGNDIVAFNDDYVGYASEIIYTPPAADITRLAPDDDYTGRASDTGLGSDVIYREPVADTYRLVIRAFTTATPGFCDVYQGVDGAPPALLDSNVMFGGTYVWVRWKLGEWFETGSVRDVVIDLDGDPFTGTISGGGSSGSGSSGGGSSGDGSDPYLFLIYPESAVGSKMYWDDDGAGFPNSAIVPEFGGTGTVILGSYSRYTSGRCRLALVGQSYKAPWMSPAPWSFGGESVAGTPTVTKYLEELERQKPALNELNPNERDQRVLELQRTMLSEEEIRRQAAPMPAVSTELVRRQQILLDRHGEMERDLAQMSYDERAARLAHVKRETMGTEYSEPVGPSPSQTEEKSR
jgi:hypothetical protein